MIRAFVFDLDGTLVETEKLKALSYARAATALRLTGDKGKKREGRSDQRKAKAKEKKGDLKDLLS